MKETIAIIIMFVLFASSFQMANGHKPLKVVDSNNDFSTAKEIPNHKISWAIYEEFSVSNDVHFYKFCADEGERLYSPTINPQTGKVLYICAVYRIGWERCALHAIWKGDTLFENMLMILATCRLQSLLG